MSHRLNKYKNLHPWSFTKWSENVVNVENANFLKANCEFLSVIWVKWKQSVCCIILLYSSTFYSLFLPFFMLEIFKLKYDKFFVRHSAFIFKFEWFEQPSCYTSNTVMTSPNLIYSHQCICHNQLINIWFWFNG